MWTLVASSILLSLLHATIPNHWLPIVAFANTQRWTLRETLGVTALAGMAHIISTIVIGVAIGFAGAGLHEQFEEATHWLATGVLVGLGIYLLVRYFLYRQHSHEHQMRNPTGASKRAIVISLCVAMFLSPCIELQGLYLAAGLQGWSSILVISLVYLLFTVTAMMLLVTLAFKSVQKLPFQYWERYNQLIMGILLIVMGILSFFLEKH